MQLAEAGGTAWARSFSPFRHVVRVVHVATVLSFRASRRAWSKFAIMACVAFAIDLRHTPPEPRM